MSGVQLHLGAFMNIGGRSSSSICCFSLHCWTSSHLYSEVLLNMLNHCLNLIGIHTLLISFLGWVSSKWHQGVRTLNRIKWSTLSCLRHPIICSKLSQRKPLNPIILLIIDEHPAVLFHTGIHSFCLAICLWMKSCQHLSINSQPTAHLLPQGWCKLWASIWNNAWQDAMKAYYLS